MNYTDTHTFSGRWITDGGFSELKPRNVFHRQLEKIELSPDENANAHILFRRRFSLDTPPRAAKIYISADDYYKLYVNGSYVGQGPAPSYHTAYGYNEIDLTPFLSKGENLIAVHTYYQGLINRVWQSGDFRHGLIFDLICDGVTVVKSDEQTRTHRHSGFLAIGKSGYDTQFMERYDSRAPEVGFERCDFDDGEWCAAKVAKHDDHTLLAQGVPMLCTEIISPIKTERRGRTLFVDFGKSYVGTLRMRARGDEGELVRLRMGAELCEDGSVRYAMRCNCDYREEWVLSGGEDTLLQFDYKAFRYAEIECDAELSDVALAARHYPASVTARLHPALSENPDARKIWELCTHSLIYGVQETIQDCTDREKGFYLGDGCYTALAHLVVTGDDRMVRKLIDDAFASSFIVGGLVTCMSCSFMQEIAEYPLILPDLLLWHYRISGDKEYLRDTVGKMVGVLEYYRERYEVSGLLRNLDRWCVVEWPKNFQDGYAVDITEGKICAEAHIAINAYYYHAIDTVNRLLSEIGEEKYRDEKYIYDSIISAFYDKERSLFVDGEEHRHVSLPANLFPYAFDMSPSPEFDAEFMKLFSQKGPSGLSFFMTFPYLFKLARDGRWKEVYDYILDRGTWRRMLDEGASATFEGWGKDLKWNTSLFHLTMASAVIFMTDKDTRNILK